MQLFVSKIKVEYRIPVVTIVALLVLTGGVEVDVVF